EPSLNQSRVLGFEARMGASPSLRCLSPPCKIESNPAHPGLGGSLLYWLLYEKLFPFFHPFRIFRYLTFRTAFASLTALLIAMFIGPYVIQNLREFQIGQYIREDGPQSHQKKSGTPTMVAVLIVIALLLPTVLWSAPANPFVWIAVCSTLAYGTIGFADDYTKVGNRRNLGLTARAKLFWQGVA